MEERLYKFAKLVDAGSYTKAAQELHISQPALTTTIQKLERELHATLLIRGERQLRLTPAGREAYEAAGQLKAKTTDLRLRIAELGDTPVELKIGMIDSVADLLFAHAQAIPAVPSTRMSLVVDNTSRLVSYVANGDLDVAFITKTNELPASLVAERVGAEPMLLVTSPAQAAAVQAGLTQGKLREFIGYNRNSNTYRLISSYLAESGITASYSFYSTSPHIMLEFLLHGSGSSILPYALTQGYLQAHDLTSVSIKGKAYLERGILQLKRRDRYLPQQAADISRQVAEALAAFTPAKK